MGDNQKSIDYANELLDKYPNDGDIYYNVGVLYMRLAQGIETSAKDKYNKLNEMKTLNKDLVKEAYSDFKDLRRYANSAKDYFYEASDLEEEKNKDTEDAINEMKKAIKQVDNIYLESVKQIAKSAGIELD